MTSITPQKEAAARPGTAAANYEYTPEYSRELQKSSPSREILTRDALGGLLFYILIRPLPEAESRLAWRLLDRWTRQLVDARHVEGAAA